MKIRTAAAIVLTAGFALLLVLLMDKEEVKKPVQVVSAEDCGSCHPQVYAEWKDSWHAKAWLDPLVRDKQQSDNFKKKDCIPCHAPRPIFERGIGPGQRVVERVARREDGVDCNSCHKLPEGGFASTSQDAQGPCVPVFRPALASEALCAPCHNQHNTVNEWLDAPPELKGESCADCHMPVRDRGGRKGRDHTFAGGHYPDLLKSAYTLKHEFLHEGDALFLQVRVINDKTAHNLPTDSRHRALDLVVTLFKEGEVPYPAMDGEREAGQEAGTYRLRFRNPYRSEYGKEDTQIRSGREAVLKVPIPAEAQTASIELIFKLTPFMKDEEGFRLETRRFPLDSKS